MECCGGAVESGIAVGGGVLGVVLGALVPGLAGSAVLGFGAAVSGAGAAVEGGGVAVDPSGVTVASGIGVEGEFPGFELPGAAVDPVLGEPDVEPGVVALGVALFGAAVPGLGVADGDEPVWLGVLEPDVLDPDMPV
jgi:hypothetical protein